MLFKDRLRGANSHCTKADISTQVGKIQSLAESVDEFCPAQTLPESSVGITSGAERSVEVSIFRLPDRTSVVSMGVLGSEEEECDVILDIIFYTPGETSWVVMVLCTSQ